KDTNGNLTIFEYTGNEKGGPPLHVHPYQDEIFFIVQGEYLFQVGDEKHNLKSGDTIFLPRAVPHAFAQLSDNGKMFFLFQPSGKMEDFFRTLSNLTSPPTAEQGAKIFADHDMKIVGPPIKY
ncbi:MAG: cupin domain-containing protein, partial [Bacteroidetes bacterium]|nr:cupin domain-containing protein [Bacteroidota bacterium]